MAHSSTRSLIRQIALIAPIAATAVLAVPQGAGAVPAGLARCYGSYTATVHSQGTTWRTTASRLFQKGTTCGTAKSVAGVYTRSFCDECNGIPYHGAWSYTRTGHLRSGVYRITAKNGGEIVTFREVSRPV